MSLGDYCYYDCYSIDGSCYGGCCSGGGFFSCCKGGCYFMDDDMDFSIMYV